MRAHELRLAMLVALCGILASGCGDGKTEPQLDVFPASGQVTLGGRPACGVFVMLHPASGSAAAVAGVNPCATTDENGAFQISTYRQNDGAPAGAYAITLRCFQADPEAESAPIPGMTLPSDRFQSKYADPKQSPWAATITESDENAIPPIHLE